MDILSGSSLFTAIVDQTMSKDSRDNGQSSYPLTWSLTDDQFRSLSTNNIMLLQIDWTRSESVKGPTGTKKAFQRNLLAPLPSYFAATDDIDAIIKKIGQWWGLQSTKLQLIEIGKYADSLDLSEKIKREYIFNAEISTGEAC